MATQFVSSMPPSDKTDVKLIGLYRAEPLEKIQIIREGIPARWAKHFVSSLELEQQVIYHALGLKTATFNRKVKDNKALDKSDSERIVGFAELVGLVQAIVEESGDATDFNAQTWLANWLKQPVAALGGVKPIDYLDTLNGQKIVSDLLKQMQTGAYS